MGAVVKITNKKATAIIDVPFGEYAIAGFQDLDGNGVLTGNFLGIPREPVGFSGDAKIRFGPPKWNDAVFKFKEIDQKVFIYLGNKSLISVSFPLLLVPISNCLIFCFTI